MTIVKIPVVVGKNRLRGHATGALVTDDDGQDKLRALRDVLRKEAQLADVDPTADWLAIAVRQILDLYEEGWKNWQVRKQGTVGFVYEYAMPSGLSLLLGESRVLQRVSGPTRH